MDEFEIVGNIVKVFVFDNVIVVIGILLDFDMVDEICVIVVVTGIGNEKKLDIIFVVGGKFKVVFVLVLVIFCVEEKVV